MLALLLAVAILMGVGIGIIVARWGTLKRATPIVESQIPLLQERLMKISNDIDSKKARGESPPPHALELFFSAQVAIGKNEAQRAEANIIELERMLGRGGAVEGPAAKPVIESPPPGGT